MKILLVSDSPYHETGYGRLSRSLARRMIADGHEVVIYSPGGLYGIEPITTPDGITIIGAAWNDDRWGNNTIGHHLARQKADLMITLLDAHGLTHYGWDGTPWIAWAFIDTWPLPKQEAGQLGRAAKVIVPSKWGVQVCQDAGVDAEYVPGAIESAEFSFDPEGRQRFRKLIGVDDDQFLVGMVGLNYSNPDRKGWGWMFEIIGKVHETYPNVRGWAQTDPKSGMDLYAIRETLGLGDVIGLPQAPPIGTLPQHAIRDMYSAFDCLLTASTTEGFGLPVVEMQANGGPVVLNAATSIKELAGPGSSATHPLGHSWLDTGTRISIPHIEAMALSLGVQVKTWQYQRGLDVEPRTAPIARQRIGWAQQFDFDYVYEAYWRPLIAEVPSRVEPEIHAVRKLQLGCGNTPHAGFTHHDRERHSDFVDVAHDLTDFPWPFADASYDYVTLEDVLEHLRGDLPQVFAELWRILDKDGYLFIRTCEAGSWMHAYDPTHVRGFALNSFNYWDPDTKEGQSYGMEAGERKWKVVRRSLHGMGEIEVLMQPRKEAPAVIETQSREMVAAD